MCHITPHHILELTLEVILKVILEHVLGIRIMTSLILDHVARAYLDLGISIDRNCDVLPLLKFCTNKPILASLLRQFFGGGERGRFAPKKGVTLLPRATDL